MNFDDISSSKLDLPAEMGGLGVSFASILALPAFLASAFGATDILTTIFSETFEDDWFTKELEVGRFEKTGKSSRWKPEKLDTTCMRQNCPRFEF